MSRGSFNFAISTSVSGLGRLQNFSAGIRDAPCGVPPSAVLKSVRVAAQGAFVRNLTRRLIKERGSPLSGSNIRANLVRVRERIGASCDRAGRDPSSIRLVAVSKTFPADRIVEAYQCGLRDFGENRIQEFQQKLATLNLPEATFHFIGHLQTNKVSQALAFDWVQTLDSRRLALRLNDAAAGADKVVSVLIEVKLSEEASKTGVSEAEASDLTDFVVSLPQLRLKGLMTIPPYSPDVELSRSYFRRLRQLRDRLRDAGHHGLQELSMGMSQDFPVAIEEGATIIRVGTGIFGPRPPAAGR